MADGSQLMRDAMTRNFVLHVPHNHALGLEPLEIGGGIARFKLPWAEHLIGNPDTGVLHGGAITAMLDACCGAAVFAALGELKPIATLDLRIDYLKPAEARRDVASRAHCYKVTRNVAFVRAVAFHDTEDDPIASAAGTFMLGTKRGGSSRTGGAKPP
jgi:uncharacterized protein (TIGR00369 family)